MTANTSNSLLTDNYFSLEVEKLYYSLVPNSDLKYNTDNNLYLFLSALKNWDNEFQPPIPENNQKYFKQVKKHIFAIKKIATPDVSPVIERIDWKSNSFYDTYSDEENLFSKDVNGKLIKKFYVRNCFDQVFKCLWNGQTTSNSYIIGTITNSGNSYLNITHSGPDLGAGRYIRIQDCNPSNFNGIYKTAITRQGNVSIIIANDEKYKIPTGNASSVYVSGGSIKYLEPTSEEPVFDVGTFNKEEIIITEDGYKWKYVYTIDQGKKQKFFSRDWMPISIKTDTTYSANASFGQIDVINVINQGSGYQNGTGTIAVTITGDGQDAFASTYVNANNNLIDIYMINPGNNYTSANVKLTPNAFGGNGARVWFSISPPGGHGSDPLTEFGCRNAMITCQVVGTESNKIPVDITYRQLGLISNPYSQKDLTKPANNSVYEVDTKILITNESGTFLKDEIVYQGTDVGNTTFKANCLTFTANDDLKVINTLGIMQQDYPIYGATSGASATVLQEVIPDIIINSGKISYIENRIGITRSEDDSELFRLVINY